MMAGGKKMKSFIDQIINRTNELQSRICVGLDPHLNLLPMGYYSNKNIDNLSKEELSTIILDFNKSIIDKIYNITLAVKLQIAFYEQLEESGIEVLHLTAKYAYNKGIPVILDAKRNDIGSTASAYARAYLEKEYIGAITLNPYLGEDSLKPFLQYKNKAVFALVRTSNNGAGDIQNIKLNNGEYLYNRIGKLINKWGKKYKLNQQFSALGAVVGATYPKELSQLRRQMTDNYFLVPGYGAQGGRAEDIKNAFNDKGLGAIINSSRGIIFAYRNTKKYTESEYALAARKAAIKMKNEINDIIKGGK